MTSYLSKKIKMSIALTIILSLSVAEASRTVPVDRSVGSASQTTQNLARPIAPDEIKVLSSIAAEVRAKLTELDGLMRAGRTGEALAQAKALLDDVRIKSGIHPKASYREKIQVPAGVIQSVGSVRTPLERLRIDTQDALVLSVNGYRGGYFLDILNLMKRVNLIYIKAFHQSLKTHSGGLLKRDIEKIRQDILEVHAVPLYLKDSKFPDYYLVFDFEVANSDQSYLFNRELIDYILTLGSELGIESEVQIESLLSTHIKSVRDNYFATLKPGKTEESNKTKQNGIFHDSGFKKCVRLATLSLHAHNAANLCLAETKVYQFHNNPEFDECFAIYRSSLHAHNAIARCIDITK